MYRPNSASMMTMIITLMISLVGHGSESRAELKGFSAVPKSPALSSSKKQEHYFKIDFTRLNEKLVWTVWIEKVDRGIYPTLQPGYASESLIVYFDLSPDRKWVHLFEVDPTRSLANDGKLIDRFPVAHESANDVTFDFAQGLPKRFFKAWVAPDEQVEFKVGHSYVYGLVNSANSITFSQGLVLKDRSQSHLVLHHAFRILKGSSSLTPVKLINPWEIGFFPATFPTEETQTERAIRRYDISKPITWYISSNTPKEAREAVRRGLLSWNEAFGREVIRVELLSQPINWADARFNVFQWSEDDRFCGNTAAIGVSEANPVTGEIFVGKILLCAGKSRRLYEHGVYPEAITKPDFESKLFEWMAAHELGHVLGLMHNFHGKSYHDPRHPEVLNSTVMDYPFPQELAKFSGVGPRDHAMIRFAYLENGSDQALDEVRSFAYCTDPDVKTDPDCNQFLAGRLNAKQLGARYLNLLRKGAQLPLMEHFARKAVLKNLFRQGAVGLEQAQELMALYPGSFSVLVDELVMFGGSMKTQIQSLPVSERQKVLGFISREALQQRSNVNIVDRFRLLELLASFGDIVAFQTLEATLSQVEALAKDSEAPDRLTELFRLRAKTQSLLNSFWEADRQ